MGFARAADVPVVLAGDIERGGVIAQLVGTVLLLEPEERALLVGYVVNKFRGDPALFDDAHPWIEARTGLRSLGVVTWLERARDLPKEDILGLAELAAAGAGAGDGRSGWRCRGCRGSPTSTISTRSRPSPTSICASWSRARRCRATPIWWCCRAARRTLGDLAALRAEGWDVDILAHVRRGGSVLGLCGGYQMLGQRIDDPLGLEGSAGGADGLGLLEVETVLEPAKVLAVRAWREVRSGEPVRGYEIHMGRTAGPGLARPMLRDGAAADGAVSADGRVMGCYLHGILAADGFRARAPGADPSAGGCRPGLRGAGRGGAGRARRPSRALPRSRPAAGRWRARPRQRELPPGRRPRTSATRPARPAQSHGRCRPASTSARPSPIQPSSTVRPA